MIRRGYDFARSKKLKVARSEEADFTATAPNAMPEPPAAKRPGKVSAAAPKDTCETPVAKRTSRVSAARPVRPARYDRERGLTIDKPHLNIDIHGIVPVGQMPNGTIKAAINETTIYISTCSLPSSSSNSSRCGKAAAASTALRQRRPAASSCF